MKQRMFHVINVDVPVHVIEADFLRTIDKKAEVK